MGTDSDCNEAAPYAFVNAMKVLNFRKSDAPPMPAHQARIDAIQAAARAQSAPAEPRTLFREPAKPALAPSGDPVAVRLEEEIRYARRLVEAAGDALAGDSLVLHRHQLTLQGFDIIAQMLGHLASVAGAEDRDEAIARIGMTDLRARLSRSSKSVGETGTMAGLQRSDANPFSDY